MWPPLSWISFFSPRRSFNDTFFKGCIAWIFIKEQRVVFIVGGGVRHSCVCMCMRKYLPREIKRYWSQSALVDISLSDLLWVSSWSPKNETVVISCILWQQINFTYREEKTKWAVGWCYGWIRDLGHRWSGAIGFTCDVSSSAGCSRPLITDSCFTFRFLGPMFFVRLSFWQNQFVAVGFIPHRCLLDTKGPLHFDPSVNCALLC